jgi:glycosyltransferase involved in cell wall biosynthesis
MLAASLIIPTLDRQDHVRVLLESLKRQTRQDFEVVVVDQTDAPDAEVRRMAEVDTGRFQYLHLERKSLPNARNVGAAAARSEILIFIDDDVELSAGFVAAHVSALEALDGPDAAAGRITGGYDDGDPDARLVGKFNPWLATVTRNFHLLKGARGIHQLPGGNFSVRREAFFAAGGFDAEGFCGTASIGEETDFAMRLIYTGHQIDFVPKAHLIHLHLPMGGCRDRSVVTWTYWHGHNMALLARRYSGLLRMPVFVAAQVLRYAAHGIKRKSLSVTLAGWRGLVRGLTRHAPPPVPAKL